MSYDNNTITINIKIQCKIYSQEKTRTFLKIIQECHIHAQGLL